MRKPTLLTLVCVFFLQTGPCANAWSGQAASAPLAISKPDNQSTVPMETVVAGSVANPDLAVYVLIHPLKSNLWWVQNIPVVDADGSFQCYCYFGTRTQGRGEPFEIVAIAANHGKPFKAGQTFKNIPPAVHRSRLVRVRREK